MSFAGDCQHPAILVDALDSNFHIQTFEPDDLRVEVNRKPVQVLSVLLDKRPRRIVVMVDTSGSMEVSPQKRGWGLTLPAAAYAVDIVPANGTAALVTFSDKLQRESGDFEERNVVGAKVLNLKSRQPQGATRLWDSIHQVLNDFTSLSLGDAVYVVTDGGDNKSKFSIAQLKKEFTNRGIRIFAFLVQRAAPRTEEENEGASELEDLAKFTGGDVVQISSADVAAEYHAKLGKLAPHLTSEVESVYRVELGVSPEARVARVKMSPNYKGRSTNFAYSHLTSCSPANAN